MKKMIIFYQITLMKFSYQKKNINMIEYIIGAIIIACMIGYYFYYRKTWDKIFLDKCKEIISTSDINIHSDIISYMSICRSYLGFCLDMVPDYKNKKITKEHFDDYVSSYRNNTNTMKMEYIKMKNMLNNESKRKYISICTGDDQLVWYLINHIDEFQFIQLCKWYNILCFLIDQKYPDIIFIDEKIHETNSKKCLQNIEKNIQRIEKMDNIPYKQYFDEMKMDIQFYKNYKMVNS